MVWLRKCVAAAGLPDSPNQKDFAGVLGVTRTRYASWEQGDSQPTVDAARVIKSRYGVSLDFLYDGEENTLPANLRNLWNDFKKAR